jgi:hypothetical protein
MEIKNRETIKILYFKFTKLIFYLFIKLFGREGFFARIFFFYVVMLYLCIYCAPQCWAWIFKT